MRRFDPEQLLDSLPEMDIWQAPGSSHEIEAKPFFYNGYPPLKNAYNGFAGYERKRGAMVLRWLKSMGVVQEPTVCSICKAEADAETQVNHHDENYYNILTATAVCKSCHARLHLRWRHKKSWADLVAKYADGTQWFEFVNTGDFFDLGAYLRQKHGEGIRDLLNSTLMPLPDWIPAPTNALYPLEPDYDKVKSWWQAESRKFRN